MKAVLFSVVLVACSPDPTPTGAVCPDPDPMTVGYDKLLDPTCAPGDDTGACGFGKHFMQTYCVSCHDHLLVRSQRHGAPLYHDFDTLLGVLKVANHVDEQTGFGPKAKNTFMPPSRCPSVPGGPLDIDCPQPTDDEREQMAIWLACENARDHDFSVETDAGVDAP
jgi:hypothetical protein